MSASKNGKLNINEINNDKNGDTDNFGVINSDHIKTGMDLGSDNENTYIIVVSNEHDDGLNVSYINDNVVKNEMDYDGARLELFGRTPTSTNSMCRLCMSSDDNSSSSKLLPLFSSSTKLKFISISIVTVLESLTGLKVSEDDELPKYVCKVCLSRLEICWAFRQQCLKSDKVMRELNQATRQFCEMSNTAAVFPTKNLKKNQQCAFDKDNNEFGDTDGVNLGCDEDLEKVKHLLGRKFSRESKTDKNSNKAYKCRNKLGKEKVEKRTGSSRTENPNSITDRVDNKKVNLVTRPIKKKNSENISPKKHAKKKIQESQTQQADDVRIDFSSNSEVILSFDSNLEEGYSELVSKGGSISEELNDQVSKHCPVLHPGRLLRCKLCWNTTDSDGKIVRRTTQYHCLKCETNLCRVPCFKEYHEKVVIDKKDLGHGSHDDGNASNTNLTDISRRQQTCNLIQNNSRLSVSMKQRLLNVASKLL